MVIFQLSLVPCSCMSFLFLPVLLGRVNLFSPAVWNLAEPYHPCWTLAAPEQTRSIAAVPQSKGSAGWQHPIQAALQGEQPSIFWEMRLSGANLLLQVRCRIQYFLILGIFGTVIMKINDNQLFFFKEEGTKIILMQILLRNQFSPWECWHLNAF